MSAISGFLKVLGFSYHYMAIFLELCFVNFSFGMLIMDVCATVQQYMLFLLHKST
jgi:hypothetical protein